MLKLTDNHQKESVRATLKRRAQNNAYVLRQAGITPGKTKLKPPPGNGGQKPAA